MFFSNFNQTHGWLLTIARQAALEAMSDQELDQNVKGLIAAKLEKPKSLKLEISRYEPEILHPKTYVFDRSTWRWLLISF